MKISAVIRIRWEAGGTDEGELDASRNRSPEDSNSEPRPSPQLDVDNRSNKQTENTRQTGDRAYTGDAIHRNAGFCKQEGQRSEVEAVDHSEGSNKQAEDPRRRPSALSIHVQQSLANRCSQKYRKGEDINEEKSLAILLRLGSWP